MLLDRKLHNCYLCSIRPLIDKNNLLIVIMEQVQITVTVFHSIYSVHG